MSSLNELREPEEGWKPQLIGNSPAWIEVFKNIGRVAATDVGVLLLGESGTGIVELATWQGSRPRERTGDCGTADEHGEAGASSGGYERIAEKTRSGEFGDDRIMV